ncbi:type II secretion system protein GspM [Enterovibrio sp. Hal110]
MNAFLEKLKQGFEGLTAREQWLIASAGWLLIMGLGVFIFLEPIAKTLSATKTEFSQQQQTTKDLLALNMMKQEKLNTSANAELEITLASLNQEIALLDAEMARKTEGLVSAPQMANLMESVLKQSDKLTLLSMTTLPAAQLTEKDQAGFYLHPVEIELQGRYFDILDYLAALEALPVKYYWRSVDYRVKAYPLAEVTLQVYTLGESPVFIGGVHANNG